jgi:outer membrane protein
MVLISERGVTSNAYFSYDKNAANILELLNAESILADAKQEWVRTVAGYHSAKLRLHAHAGILGRVDFSPSGLIN